MDELTCLRPGEHVEVFGKGLPLIVSKAHTFGTDAFLLADFAQKAKTAADLGTGCGVIPFLLLRDGKAEKIFAVDVQPEAIDQLKRSVSLAGTDAVEPVLADLRALPAEVPAGRFDLVTMNPPYTAAGAGIESADASSRAARHGVLCSLDDVCRAGARLLRFGGSLCVCVPPARIASLFAAMQAQRIEPKRLRLVCKKPGCAPWLALVEGRSGGRPGLRVREDLYVYDGDDLSDEMKRITGEYRDKEAV